MWCSSCAKGVRETVARIDGVKATEINFASKLLVVEFQDPARRDAVDHEVRNRIDQMGFGIKIQPNGWILDFENDLSKELNARLSWPFIFFISFLAMWSSMFGFARYAGGPLSLNESFYLSVASSAAGLPAILLGIRSYAEAGFRTLRFTRRLNLDFFIALGGLAAVGISLISLFNGRADSYADSGSMIVALLLLVKKIENEVVRKVTSSILFELRPGRGQVSVWKNELWQPGESSQIKKGDRVQFKKNETILFDAVLCSSKGAVNSHLLTGEDNSLPLAQGDNVYAGMIAQTDMELLVLAPLGCRRIDHWATHALAGNVRHTRYAQILVRAESLLTTFALSGAFLAAAIAALKGESPAQIVEAFFIGVLVFCPCLFASILPLAKQVAHLSLLRTGVMLSRADALLDLRDVRTLYFDKTGTLESIHSHFEASEGSRFDSAYLEDLASQSQHPVLRGMENRRHLGLLTSVQEFPGQGVSAFTYDNSPLMVGRASFLEQHGIVLKPNFDRDFPGVTFKGRLEGQIIIKKIYDMKSRRILQRLLEQVPKIKIAILSGDPAMGAGEPYLQLDPRITYHGNLSPEAKASEMESPCAFVGDGLNDTLALAKADVSFRVGNRVTGFAPVDFLLQTPNLRLISSTIAYSKRYRSILMQTVALAFLYNASALTLAGLGRFSPLGAVLSMLASFSILFLSIFRLSKQEKT